MCCGWRWNWSGKSEKVVISVTMEVAPWSVHGGVLYDGKVLYACVRVSIHMMGLWDVVLAKCWLCYGDRNVI